MAGHDSILSVRSWLAWILREAEELHILVVQVASADLLPCVRVLREASSPSEHAMLLLAGHARAIGHSAVLDPSGNGDSRIRGKSGSKSFAAHIMAPPAAQLAQPCRVGSLMLLALDQQLALPPQRAQ